MIKGREEEAVDKKRGGMPNYERSEWENPRKDVYILTNIRAENKVLHILFVGCRKPHLPTLN